MNKAMKNALAKIKIGEKYYVVGSYGGCGNDCRCKDCTHYVKPAFITVTGIYKDDGPRHVSGYSSISNENHCSFDPRDLMPVNQNWKRRLE